MLFCLVLPVLTSGQAPKLKFPINAPLSGYVNSSLNIRESWKYSFSTSNYLVFNKAGQVSPGWITLLQGFEYNFSIEKKKCYSFETRFYHTLGFQYLIDSSFSKNLDENRYTASFKYHFGKNIYIKLASDTETPFLNKYTFTLNDSAQMVRTLQSSFLSPMLTLFSCGFNLTKSELGSFTIGISSARLVVVVNQKVLKGSDDKAFYGIDKGGWLLLEYGISSELMIDKELSESMDWNLDIKAFKAFRMPVDVRINNEITVRPVKYLRVTVQTKLVYDRDINKKVGIENLLTVGFCVEGKNPG